jgi:hypothetical protein
MARTRCGHPTYAKKFRVERRLVHDVINGLIKRGVNSKKSNGKKPEFEQKKTKVTKELRSYRYTALHLRRVLQEGAERAEVEDDAPRGRKAVALNRKGDSNLLNR